MASAAVGHRRTIAPAGTQQIVVLNGRLRATRYRIGVVVVDEGAKAKALVVDEGLKVRGEGARTNMLVMTIPLN